MFDLCVKCYSYHFRDFEFKRHGIVNIQWDLPKISTNPRYICTKILIVWFCSLKQQMRNSNAQRITSKARVSTHVLFKTSLEVSLKFVCDKSICTAAICEPYRHYLNCTGKNVHARKTADCRLLNWIMSPFPSLKANCKKANGSVII